MFVLTKVKHELRIAPQKLSLPLLDAITSEIQNLFFDKVLKDMGLCITLYDVRAVEGGFVFPGDGAPRFTFFEDIHIPEHLLQQPSVFDEEEKLWIWNFNGNDMFMDLDEEVRFRVVQVKYPTIPIEQDKGAKPFAPMEITGDINADGLGLVSWW
ncbi:hypothetical protein AXG93_4492s1400 [Marchantia polymorpha subsp. ruderalis]|uniref:RNA polymerase III subunit Rpc25 domain-containing protein n=1 Tax=Marchantia polymorpha subsp. ruderalis TaxID=1480154 RepID=A0A176W5G3_MARPO|nr:hypothetical protein AXG93_4492s1400 [Marchantia polymorpha subsp. ruderalis]